MLYLGSLQISTSLFEKKQRTIKAPLGHAGDAHPEQFPRFSTAETDRHPEAFSLPFTYRTIRSSKFIQQVRQGTDQEEEGGEFSLLQFQTGSFTRQQRSVCSLGKQWGNRRHLGYFSPQLTKTVFLFLQRGIANTDYFFLLKKLCSIFWPVVNTKSAFKKNHLNSHFH